MSKKAVGICNCHYAELTITPQSSGPDTIAYGTPTKIPDLEEISITETYAEGKNYADNICNIAVKIVNNADITMTFSNVSRKIESVLAGKQYNSGQMESNVNDTQKAVAILFQKTFDDGSYENVIYYNCKLSRNDNGGSTKGESISFQGVTFSGTAIPFPNNKLSYVIASDEIAEDAQAKAKLENFFKKVQFIDVEHSA
mgnify:CR=1 FL=1